MLSLNDFKEKQILFINNSADIDSKIKFRNDNVLYVKDDENINQLSCYKIIAIFIIGDISFTTVLVRNCVKYGISIFLLNRNLETYASIESKAEGNYLLRDKQYKATNEFLTAKNLVKNKLLNQLILLKKNKDISKVEYDNKKDEIFCKIEKIKNEQELLGIEGNYTKVFFKNYFNELNWYRRMPRAKVDEYNLLLDIGYTFVLNYIDTLLRLYGFDVYKGCYHKLFFKRKSLSCDIVEPFRCIIDKQLLKSFRLGQIDKKDFKFDNGQYFLDYDKSKKYSKIFFDAIVNDKENIFNYVHDFYRFVMDNNKKFPFFEMK